MPRQLHLLHYDYVDDILERRGEHRAAHLAHAGGPHGDGRLLLGGAIGTPPTRGLLVFEVDDAAEIEAFVRADPYVVNGLVTDWRIEPWTEVVDAGA